jgi:tetratricopeptide (TPR) repeat protein
MLGWGSNGYVIQTLIGTVQRYRSRQTPCLNNLALLYFTRGQYAKAEPLYQRALSIWEKALGREHPDVANSLHNLALLYKTQGQYAKAERLYERALAIREKALGPEHPGVAKASTI